MIQYTEPISTLRKFVDNFNIIFNCHSQVVVVFVTLGLPGPGIVLLCLVLFGFVSWLETVWRACLVIGPNASRKSVD